MNRLVNQLEHEIQPALRRVNDVSGDVSRVTTLAVAQLERVDQMTAQLAERCERMISVGQEALVDPLRQGVALLHGLRVAIGALRDAAGDSRRAPAESEGRVSDDQEALFIG